MEACNGKYPRRRRRFTDEFKAGAVRMVLEEGRSINDVARELDLVPSALGTWVRKAKTEAGRAGGCDDGLSVQWSYASASEQDGLPRQAGVFRLGLAARPVGPTRGGE